MTYHEPEARGAMQIAAVVVERELRLRQAMRTMGLLDSAYWASWAAYEVPLPSSLCNDHFVFCLCNISCNAFVGASQWHSRTSGVTLVLIYQRVLRKFVTTHPKISNKFYHHPHTNCPPFIEQVMVTSTWVPFPPEPAANCCNAHCQLGGLQANLRNLI